MIKRAKMTQHADTEYLELFDYAHKVELYNSDVRTSDNALIVNRRRYSRRRHALWFVVEVPPANVSQFWFPWGCFFAQLTQAMCNLIIIIMCDLD